MYHICIGGLERDGQIGKIWDDLPWGQAVQNPDCYTGNRFLFLVCR